MDKINIAEIDTKAEEKRLYEEYKQKLKALKKVEKENEAVGQVFAKGLLPIYVMFILSLGPTNGNDISRQIGERTGGLWIPSTGGIYPILKKMEKEDFVKGEWDNPDKKIQKVYTLTENGIKEYEDKKALLKTKIEQSLKVFQSVYSDLYDKK